MLGTFHVPSTVLSILCLNSPPTVPRSGTTVYRRGNWRVTQLGNGRCGIRPGMLSSQPVSLTSLTPPSMQQGQHCLPCMVIARMKVGQKVGAPHSIHLMWALKKCILHHLWALRQTARNKKGRDRGQDSGVCSAHAASCRESANTVNGNVSPPWDNFNLFVKMSGLLRNYHLFFFSSSHTGVCKHAHAHATIHLTQECANIPKHTQIYTSHRGVQACPHTHTHTHLTQGCASIPMHTQIYTSHKGVQACP